MKRVFAYLCHRIGERSTLGDIAVAISSAAVVPNPYNLAVFMALLAKALVPDGRVFRQ
jgi:hypothetical protein